MMPSHIEMQSSFREFFSHLPVKAFTVLILSLRNSTSILLDLRRWCTTSDTLDTLPPRASHYEIRRQSFFSGVLSLKASEGRISKSKSSSEVEADDDISWPFPWTTGESNRLERARLGGLIADIRTVVGFESFAEIKDPPWSVWNFQRLKSWAHSSLVCVFSNSILNLRRSYQEYRHEVIRKGAISTGEIVEATHVGWHFLRVGHVGALIPTQSTKLQTITYKPAAQRTL